MRKGLIASIGAVLTHAGLGLAQAVLPMPMAPEPIPAPREGAPPGSKTESPPAMSLAAPVVVAEPDVVACSSCPADPSSKIWFRGEYLLWWLKDAQTSVPILTTGTPASLGIIGNPGTVTLLGDGIFNNAGFSGARMTAGAWIDRERRFGLEGSVFLLEQRGDSYTNGAPGNPPIFARPFFNLPNGPESASLINLPNAFAGTALVSASTQLWGAEANGLVNVLRLSGVRLDGLAGFRYLDLIDKFHATTNTEITTGQGASGFNGSIITGPGAVIDIRDTLNTRSQFYGGQLGARLAVVWGRWYADLLGKVALGCSHQTITAQGNTSLSLRGVGGPPATVPGGFYVVQGVAPRTVEDRFAVVPEVGVNVGYNVTPWARLSVGYTFLYWSDVVRSADHISRFLDGSRIPSSLTFVPGQAPIGSLPANNSDLWVHGLNCGLAIRY
ncbi:MAG: BBP7 family outer membrane beta-barrel protein [Gemmataceae bacterium]|nr:BBP7 family outer membrane beta-barrel protein [Gemmataceae bacterium]MDW8266172.1 BBP7 family outer membrane beta-barrel protein [Gemmataceae bacterium]